MLEFRSVLWLELCIHHCLCWNLDLCCKLELVHPSHYIMCWNPDLCCKLELVHPSHYIMCWNPDLCCKLELVHPSHYIMCWNPDLCYSLSCASITVCVGIQIFPQTSVHHPFVLDSRSLLQLQCISSFVLELRLQQLQCIILLCYNPDLTNYGGQFAV